MIGPISHEIIGALCLAAFWVAVVLVAADGLKEMRDLLRLKRRLAGVRRGEVIRGDGDGGAFATTELEQRGHALDGDEAVVDVSHGLVSTALHGGLVRIGDDEKTFAADEAGTVWPGEEVFDAGAERPEDFDAVVKRAASPRGYRRPMALAVTEGDEVWVLPGFVSTFAPGPFITKYLRKWSLYLTAHLSLALVVTVLALSAPMDSWIAQLGAALCLAHFLSSPPMLRAVRAATRTPDQARRFWLWRASPSLSLS